MARSAEPGRTALLDAGVKVLTTVGLSELSVNSVVATAGMAKGAFYQHWPSRTDYLRDLHTRFHDQLAATMTTAASTQPPGAGRLWHMLVAYLDGCLAQRASKALLVEARTQAGLGDLVATRNQSFAGIIEQDLTTLGWPENRPIATLLIAAAAEVALHELQAGTALPALRHATLALATHNPRADGFILDAESGSAYGPPGQRSLADTARSAPPRPPGPTSTGPGHDG